MFKGGTSLSRVFRVTERMSEDIDLVIDRSALGCDGDRDPSASAVSGKERDRRIAALKQAAARLVAGPFADSLSRRIRSELGARGEVRPAVAGLVTPYAAEELPEQLHWATTLVRTITVQRTFWEKLTLLHSIAHRGTAKAIRAKPARHYYDVYRLWIHGAGREAAADTHLLRDVVRHNSTVCQEPRGRGDAAASGALSLVPGACIMDAIQSEYSAMAEELVFGKVPTLKEVFGVLAEIERVVNEGVR